MAHVIVIHALDTVKVHLLQLPLRFMSKSSPTNTLLGPDENLNVGTLKVELQLSLFSSDMSIAISSRCFIYIADGRRGLGTSSAPCAMLLVVSAVPDRTGNSTRYVRLRHLRLHQRILHISSPADSCG